MLTIPKIFEQIDYVQQPLDYRWTEQMSETTIARDVDEEELLDTLSYLNYKAVFGLAAAAGEWIFWRFYKWRMEVSGKNIGVVLQATEAHWYGLIDKYYIYTWNNTVKYKDLPKTKDKIERPIWVTHRLQERVRHNYINTRPPLYGDAVRLLILARYIAADKQLFNNWLADCIKRAIPLFPNKQWPPDQELTEKNMDKNYDSNNDAFIPREFYFENGFDYETADLVKMQQNILNKADYKENDLLNPPEDMIKEGFQGTPYHYEPK